MSITCGFFNSVDGDPRRYNSEQMSAIFDGILNDGVFMSVGEIFKVVSGKGMQVLVHPGRAWLKSTWTLNNAIEPINLSASDVTHSRIDAIVLEVNHSQNIRNNTIKVVQGTPASSPKKPTLTNTNLIAQRPLAYVTIPAKSTEVNASNIEITVGKSDFPFVTGILSSVNIDALFNQWEANFEKWFTNLQTVLNEDVINNLQDQINKNKTALTISSDVLALYGRTSATLSDMFRILSVVPSDVCRVVIEFKTSAGIAIDNAVAQWSNGFVFSSSAGLCCLDLPTTVKSLTLVSPLGYSIPNSLSISPVAGQYKFYTVIGTASSTSSIFFTSSMKAYGISNRVKTLDIFISGGGGSGGASATYPSSSTSSCSEAAGGGGGYTRNLTNTSIRRLTNIVIGAGGLGVTTGKITSKEAAKAVTGKDGSSTSFTDYDTNTVYTVLGGKGGDAAAPSGEYTRGGDGGSGGGGTHQNASPVTSRAGSGGTNGSNGGTGWGGTGQGTTTKPFNSTTVAAASGGGGAYRASATGYESVGTGQHNNSGVAVYATSGDIVATGTTPSGTNYYGSGSGGVVAHTGTSSWGTSLIATSANGAVGCLGVRCDFK